MQCRWPKGCPQNTLGQDYCTYHEKVASGLITSTRGDTGRDVRKITLSPAAEERARRERERLWDEALRREAEREAEGWQHMG